MLCGKEECFALGERKGYHDHDSSITNSSLRTIRSHAVELVVYFDFSKLGRSFCALDLLDVALQ